MEVDVRASRVAGTATFGHLLASGYALPVFDQQGGIMPIVRQYPVTMIDDHQVAKAGRIPIGKDNCSTCRSKHRLAEKRTDIDCAVPAPKWLGNQDRENRV